MLFATKCNSLSLNMDDANWQLAVRGLSFSTDLDQKHFTKGGPRLISPTQHIHFGIITAKKICRFWPILLIYTLQSIYFAKKKNRFANNNNINDLYCANSSNMPISAFKRRSQAYVKLLKEIKVFLETFYSHCIPNTV